MFGLYIVRLADQMAAKFEFETLKFETRRLFSWIIGVCGQNRNAINIINEQRRMAMVIIEEADIRIFLGMLQDLMEGLEVNGSNEAIV